jgi:RNA polymerase sigma factor (sigma-70 family)
LDLLRLVPWASSPGPGVSVDMTEQDDREWVRLLKQDDPQAIQSLWELLFTYAVSLEKRYRTLDDPTNLAREAATLAFDKVRTRGIHQFRFECPFRGYCRVILARQVIDLIKQQAKQQPPLTELEIGEVIPARQERSPKNPDAIRVRLQPCLDRLASREYEVIEHLYFEESSPQTAANRLGISRNNVNVIAWRARRKLLRCLKGLGYLTVEDVLQ